MWVELLAVLGMNQVEPIARVAADLAVGVAQDRLPARRQIDLVQAQVPVPQTVVGAGRGQRVTFLTDLELHFRCVSAAGVVDGHRDHLEIAPVGVFHQIVVGSRPHRFDRGLLVSGAGDDDHRNGRLELQHVDAGSIAEVIVGEHDVEALALEQHPGLGGRTGDHYFIRQPLLADEALEGHAIDLVVLDQKQPQGLAAGVGLLDFPFASHRG